MRLVTRFMLIAIICSFIISYFWKFHNYDFIFTPHGLIFNLFFIVPGILPFLLTKSTYKIFIDILVRFGSAKYYFISFVYNLILFSGILIIGFTLKILDFANVNNFETQLLGLFFDIPLLIVLWLPSIYLYEFAWRGFILENLTENTKFKNLIKLAIIWSISFVVISIYLIIYHSIIFGVAFLISQFLNGVVLNLFYIKNRSIWLCSFHHILLIIFNSYIFGSIFEDGIIFNVKYGIFNANGVVGVLIQIFLIFFLFKVINNFKAHHSSN